MFSATWPHFGELQDAGSVGLVANSGEQMHALFMFFLLVNLFLLGQLPLTSLIVSLGSVYVIDRFTGFSLSQAAISIVFTRFVFSDQRNKED